MSNKVLVFINEQHKMLPEQEALLQKNFPGCEINFHLIPAEGYTLQQMEQIERRIMNTEIVFVSPVPVLLGSLAGMAYMTDNFVYVFHNDIREKKELPDGRIIQVVAATGWQLVRVA